MRTLAEIKKRLAEIYAELEKPENMTAADIDARSAEVTTLLQEQRDSKETKLAELRAKFENAPATTTVTREGTPDPIEERARNLKQNRAIVISDANLIHITHQDETLNPTWKPVSDLVDLIPILNFVNGESFKKGYMKTYGVGGYTAEGVAATASEPTWGYASITKAKITAYTEVSEEVEKLAPAAYVNEVLKNLSISLRKKLALEILYGAGTSDTLTGIFTAAYATAIETSKDKGFAAIDTSTLDDLLYAFGGSEDFSPGVLILNKLTLKAFATLKATDGRKYHDVNRANSTIDGVPYVINSNIPAFADINVTGTYFAAYGPLSAYALCQFSNIEVSKSTDYKFAQGQVCYKAVGFFGGNVAQWNGFIRAKKTIA